MIVYKAEVLEKIKNRPGTWNSILVGVFRCEGDNKEQVGLILLESLAPEFRCGI